MITDPNRVDTLGKSWWSYWVLLSLWPRPVQLEVAARCEGCQLYHGQLPGSIWGGVHQKNDCTAIPGDILRVRQLVSYYIYTHTHVCSVELTKSRAFRAIRSTMASHPLLAAVLSRKGEGKVVAQRQSVLQTCRDDLPHQSCSGSCQQSWILPKTPMHNAQPPCPRHWNSQKVFPRHQPPSAAAQEVLPQLPKPTRLNFPAKVMLTTCRGRLQVAGAKKTTSAIQHFALTVRQSSSTSQSILQDFLENDKSSEIIRNLALLYKTWVVSLKVNLFFVTKGLTVRLWAPGGQQVERVSCSKASSLSDASGPWPV